MRNISDMWFYRSMLSKALTGGALAGLAICGALAGSLLLEHTAQVERLEDVLETSTQRFMLEAQRTHQAAIAQSIARTSGGGATESPSVMTSLMDGLVGGHPELVKVEWFAKDGTLKQEVRGQGNPSPALSSHFDIPLPAKNGSPNGMLVVTYTRENIDKVRNQVHQVIVERADRDRYGHLKVIAWFSLLVMSVALAMSGWLGFRLRHWIVEIRSAARRLAGGDYETPVVRHSGDEIGDLAESVDYLRQRLKVTTISRNYLDSVLNSMPDAVLVTTPEGIIRRTNDATEKLLGWAEFELVGRELRSIIGETDRATFNLATVHEIGETIVETHGGQSIPVSISGSTLSGDDVQFRGYVFVLRNITERKRAERRIRYLARYDTLTKIPNRMQFQHLLQQALARNLRQGRAVALFYIDLDRFKEVNDTFGHAAGDRTLEVLTERLQRLLPKDAALGRLAGDEFAIFVEGLPAADTREVVIPIGRQLLDGINGAFWLQGNEVYLSASLGISLAPRDAENVVDLVRNADAAMYHAKQNGGGSFTFYTPEMNNAAVERLMLKSKLRRSLERDEFVMLYQPKVDLRTGRIVGAEALLRWRLPGHGDISPAHFIPIAEESNLILAIGEWVMRRVCQEYAQWQKAVSNPGRVSINLSLKQLRQASFITRCQSVFREAGVSPSCFELEVTETTLMTDAKRTVKLLDELYALGIHLSIDDFGTGYSSLSTLQQLPVGTLKIDQSFVANSVGTPDDAALVRTMIEMGRNLKLDVVAEGVETPEQLALLRELGCDYAQGMLLGVPMSGEALLALLVEQARGTPVLAQHFG
jgi:diguanylate cyclase (GGDEF)-like protein/PAS domain S-box-containing protein